MRTLISQLVSELVAVNSVNPSFAGPCSGAGGERPIVELLQRKLSELGLETWVVDSASEDRPSLVARLAGSGSGRSLMLNGHVDTVGVETMKTPFEPRIDGDRLYGRGAYDMKGGLAACFAAVHALVEEGIRLEGDLWLSAVADEEYSSLGAQAVTKRFTTDGTIITEPTDLAIAIAHKGFAWFEGRTEGFACHGSLPSRGLDANRRIAPLFRALDVLESERDQLVHPVLGAPSLHVGRIEGGLGPSIYSPACEMTIELRTLPGESVNQLLDRLRALVAIELGPTASYRIALESKLERPPFESDPDGLLARALSGAIGASTDERDCFVGVPYWTDAAYFARSSNEVLLFGPSGEGAHEDAEWVDLTSVVTVATALKETAITYCGLFEKGL